MRRQHRRDFLLTLGAAAGAVVLGGCGTDQTTASAPSAPPTPSPTGSPPSTQASLDALVAQAAPQAANDLNVITGSFEQLVGEDLPVAFGLTDAENNPLAGADIRLYAVPSGGDAIGPVPTEFREVPGNPLGLYVTRIDLVDPEITALVAVTADGERAGAATLPVRTAEQSAFPAPTEPAITVPTPTVAAPGDLAQLCTSDPPCSMHEVSLDQALREGRPVVLEFSTPAYCQTAVCGPSVEILDEVRGSGDWGDVAFIHVEIYSDQGQTPVEAVTRWQLPSEPWLYAIGADGIITARSDGPLLTLPDEVERIASRAV